MTDKNDEHATDVPAAPLVRTNAPCFACGWDKPWHPETHEEPPIVFGAMEAQADAEKRWFAEKRRAERAEASAEKEKRRADLYAAWIRELRERMAGCSDDSLRASLNDCIDQILPRVR